MSLEDQIEIYLSRFKKKRLTKPVRCATCGQHGPLHWHAIYHRSLITFKGTVTLPIQRILCATCHHTFALVPDFVLKFRRYAKAIIRFALRLLPHRSYNAVADLLMERCHRYVATLTLYFWYRRFVRSPV